MYKKVMTIKNILIIGLLAFSIACLFQSCSYAWTFDDFLYFAESIKGQNVNFDKSINVLINNQNKIRSVIGSINYSSFVCTNPNPNGGYAEFHFYLNPLQISYNNGQNIGFTYTDSNSAYRDNLFSVNYNNGNVTRTQWQSTSSWSINNAYGLVDTSNNWTNWGNGYFNNRYVEPYTGPVFSPSNNGNINVVAPNGQSESMLRLPFSYSGQNDWTLGYLSDFKDVYQIHGYFGPMVFVSGELYTEGYQNTFLYDKYYGINNNNLIFDKSSGRISINKNSLLNKQAYNLYLSYTLDSTSTSEDIGDFNYYAYYYNLSISSGDLMSPDLNSTVDVSIVRALTDYFNFNSGDADSLNYVLDSNIFNFSLSGDLFSGDIALKMGYKDYFDNDYSSFIYSIYRNVLTLLSEEGTNSHITFSLRGNTYNIYARDFRVPDGALKSFIRLFLISGYVYLIYLQIHSIILAITILDFNSLLHSFDRDHSFFM